MASVLSLLTVFNVTYQNLSWSNFNNASVNNTALSLTVMKLMQNPEYSSFFDNNTMWFDVIQSTLGSDVSVLECLPGSYAGVGASVCTLCPAGTFSVVPRAFSSDVCEKCKGGTYSTTLGASSASEMCVPCPENTYSNTSGLSHWNQCTLCPQNAVSGNGSLKIQDCACVKGYQSWSNATVVLACEACAVGYYKSTVENTKCVACGAGTYVDTEGSDDSNKCVACSAGTYSTGGARTCTKCLHGGFAGIQASVCTDCARGTYQEEKNEIVRDASSCQVCPMGYYCPWKGQALQYTRIMCSRGSYTVNNGSSVLEQCVNCPSNYFCPTSFWKYACPGSSVSPPGSISLFNCSCVPGMDCMYKQIGKNDIQLNMTLAFFNNLTVQERFAYAVANASLLTTEKVFLVQVYEL